MSTDVLFYTQLGSLISYAVALFVIYRTLVKAKDATIELLNKRIDGLSAENTKLMRQEPDVLSQSLATRNRLLTEEVKVLHDQQETLDKEKSVLRKQMLELQRRLEHVSEREETRKIVHLIVNKTSQLERLDERADAIAQEWFKRIYDPRLGPFTGTRIPLLPPRSLAVILEAFIAYNPERISTLIDSQSPDDLQHEFATFLNGIATGAPSGSELDALMEEGLTDESNRLTMRGIEAVKLLVRKQASLVVP